MGEYTAAEMMVVEASRWLRDGETVLVGIGLPNLAANLARRQHATGLVLFYESGVIGAAPQRLPLSIGDPCLVEGAVAVVSMFELFSFYLQAGRIDVGFLEAAQVDQFGNLNSTVIGPYTAPRVRLPGSGGACDIATLARRVVIMMPHRRQRFPKRVDFITSPGFLRGRRERAALGLAGGGPAVLVTDLGVLEFDESGEMVLTAIHPGSDVDQIRAETEWPLRIADSLRITASPGAEELAVLRVLDHEGTHLRRGQ